MPKNLDFNQKTETTHESSRKGERVCTLVCERQGAPIQTAAISKSPVWAMRVLFKIIHFFPILGVNSTPHYLEKKYKNNKI